MERRLNCRHNAFDPAAVSFPSLVAQPFAFCRVGSADGMRSAMVALTMAAALYAASTGASYSVMPLNTNTCTVGTSAITSSADCEAAAISEGYPIV